MHGRGWGLAALPVRSLPSGPYRTGAHTSDTFGESPEPNRPARSGSGASLPRRRLTISSHRNHGLESDSRLGGVVVGDFPLLTFAMLRGRSKQLVDLVVELVVLGLRLADLACESADSPTRLASASVRSSLDVRCPRLGWAVGNAVGLALGPRLAVAGSVLSHVLRSRRWLRWTPDPPVRRLSTTAAAGAERLV